MVYTDTLNSSLNYTLTFSYDDSGNVTGIDDTRGSAYDQAFIWEGRSLISQTIGSTSITYTYNQNGIRDSKTIGSVTTNYYLNGSLVLYETDGTNQIYYTYDVDGSLISMRYNGTEYFYMFDVFGNVTYLVDSSGYTVVYYRYDAYGNIIDQTSSALANANPYRYRSYRYDQESGLYYLQSRYYNPVTGRFINADGMLKASSTVLSHNMFIYTENNPVNGIDPSGYVYCLMSANQDENSRGCIGGGRSTNNLGFGDIAITIEVGYSTGGVYIGKAIVINFTDKYIETYEIVGVCVGCVINVSVGLLDNVDDPGDYEGAFASVAFSDIIGVGHSFTPDFTSGLDIYNEAEARATFFALSNPGISVSITYYTWNDESVVSWGD